jgi:hypothetical protein
MGGSFAPGARRPVAKKLLEKPVASLERRYTIAMDWHGAWIGTGHGRVARGSSGQRREDEGKRGMVPLKCSGWWEQEGYGRQPMQELKLMFSYGKIFAEGSDIVGRFEFTGFLDQERIYLFKQYLGKHHIEYHGESIGEGLYTGDWTCHGYVGGKWLIRIERVAVSETASTAEIRDLNPAD